MATASFGAELQFVTGDAVELACSVATCEGALKQLIRTELPESLPPSRLKRLQAAQAFWEEWYVKQPTHLVILKNLESLAKALRQPQDAQYYEKEALRIAPNDALATGGQP
jgi:hypothetical protein